MTASDLLDSFEALPAGDRCAVAAEILRRAADEALLPAGDDVLAPTRDWLLPMAREAEVIAPVFPSDLTENHDHYVHGKPQSLHGSGNRAMTC